MQDDLSCHLGAEMQPYANPRREIVYNRGKGDNEMNMKRRNFIGAAGAFAAVAPKIGSAAQKSDLGKERMRFGALSDIHVVAPGKQPYLEMALLKLD